MKIKYLTAIFILILHGTCFGQTKVSWDKWIWLTGEWQGEGSGIPGEGSGTFSFSFDLDSNILVRRSYSDFSPGDFKRRTVRDDLMIVYLTKGNPENAVFFDNESHVIKYRISYSDSSIVLTSEPEPKSPVFRLIYEKIKPDLVKTRFEISHDGKNYIVYVEGISNRKKVQ